jgi:DNA-binding transcriptional MerR regulator/methylmalonyl-CoA mutase cobalamin-binding subunit
MTQMEENMPKHPISFVSKSTGLTTHLVRAWERRYGAVKPTRTATNYRLYSDADIERLKLLNALSEAGHAISSIAQHSDEDLREMLRNLSMPAAPRLSMTTPSSDTTGLEEFMMACQQAVLSQDEEALSHQLSEALLALPQPVLLEGLIAPLMTWIGEAWHAGTVRIAQEHLASSVVKSFLFWLQQSTHVKPKASVITISTPPGEIHEIGALLASVSATFEGWRPLYFGANLPAAELANATVQADAHAAALSLTLQSEGAHAIQSVRDLRQFLPGHIPLLVGGAGASANRLRIEAPGIHYVDSLTTFRSKLRKNAL